MIHALEHHARVQPRAIALTAAETSLTYAELYQRVMALADFLAERDVRRLGISVENGLDWIVVRQAAGATILGCKIELTPDQQRLKSPAQTHNPAGSTAKYP